MKIPQKTKPLVSRNGFFQCSVSFIPSRSSEMSMENGQLEYVNVLLTDTYGLIYIDFLNTFFWFTIILVTSLCMNKKGVHFY